jgi:hypothetical protein
MFRNSNLTNSCIFVCRTIFKRSVYFPLIMLWCFLQLVSISCQSRWGTAPSTINHDPSTYPFLPPQTTSAIKLNGLLGPSTAVVSSMRPHTLRHTPTKIQEEISYPTQSSPSSHHQHLNVNSPLHRCTSVHFA